MALSWHGRALAAKVEAATLLAIDETTAEAVTHAKGNHSWKNRTGTLEGSIQMRPAGVEALRMVGRWGSFTVNYAIFLELGTWKMPARPYLRPAADAAYPMLAGRIRRNLAL